MVTHLALALFWTSAILIVYVYLGYPMLLWMLGQLKDQVSILSEKDFEPTVSLIIAAYNEEEVIAQKIENSLALDYPRDKLEIIVAANGCTDRTEEIVQNYNGQGVILNATSKAGKTLAQNAAVPLATGEIILFSDANSIYAPDAIRKMSQHFADRKVGIVQGRPVLDFSQSGLVGRGLSLYTQYEDVVKVLESRIGSCIVGYGPILAIRKSLFTPVRPNLMEDFVLPSIVISKGHLSLFEPDALLKEYTSQTIEDEFKTRARIASQDSHGYFVLLRYLLTRKQWFPAFQLTSHKLLRWLILPTLLGLLSSSVFLVLTTDFRIYLIVSILQLVFYALALAGLVFRHVNISLPALHIPFYFCLVNFAAFIGVIRMLNGEKKPSWEKALSTRRFYEEL